jgi:hypothetical protein
MLGAVVASASTLLLLLLPYEALVRAAERRYGMRPARIAPIHSVNAFVDDLKAGKRYPVIAVGSSRIETGLHPDLFPDAYNLGLAGSASIPALELIDSLHLRPERVLVGVSPLDLSPRGIQRGRTHIAELRPEAVVDRGASQVARTVTYSLLHSAAPDRRRNMGQWLKLRHDGGSVLGFLNNEAATAPPVERDTHGFLLSQTVADAERFTLIEWHTIPGDYARRHREPVAQFVAAVRRLTAKGTEVVLVRMPTSVTIRRYEDAETTFARDAPELARLCGVEYIDGATLVDEAFRSDRRNFSDTEHLNARGALLFSRALSSVLRESPAAASASSPGTSPSVRSSISRPSPAFLRR